jgi:hypothetical protein
MKRFAADIKPGRNSSQYRCAALRKLFVQQQTAGWLEPRVAAATDAQVVSSPWGVADSAPATFREMEAGLLRAAVLPKVKN